MQALLAWIRREPEKFFFIVRSVVLLLIALGVGVSNDMVETMLAVVATLLGIDYVATQRTHNQVYGSDEALALVENVRTAPAVPSGLWFFVLEAVRKLLPAAEVPFAMAAIAGDLLQFANKNLDAGTKADVLAFVHRKLRQLGYLKGRDFPPSTPTTLVTLLVVMLALAGCIPVVNSFSAGGAQLAYAETGVAFVPGPSTAYQVIVDIQGDQVTSLDVTDNCEATTHGMKCTADEIAEPWLIELTGFNVTALAHFVRELGGRPYMVLPQ